jgi:hypothetical protein
MSIERTAKLLSDATGACPCDTSRTDCEDIDGWQPKQGCVDVCGMWQEWIEETSGNCDKGDKADG